MQTEALLDHADFIRDLARSLTFGDEDPDDLVQQVWLATIESPPGRGGPGRGWLATVARNALRQSRRSRVRRVARESSASGPKQIPTPEEIREKEATRREVVEAVLTLDEPYRTAVILRYYEDLPPRAIAERLELPVETVKTRLVRARGMLRSRLDERHGGGGKRWGAALLLLSGDEGREISPAPIPAGLPIAWIAAILVAVSALGVTVYSIATSAESGRPPEPDPGTVRAAAVVEGAEEDGKPALPAEDEPPAPTEGRTEGGREGGGDPAQSRPAPPAGGAVVKGLVFDEATEKPLPDLTVVMRIWAEPFEMRETKTDAEGRYRFEGVPTDVRVQASLNRGGRYVAVSRPVSTRRALGKGEVLEDDLAAKRQVGVELRIRIELPEGADLPDEIRMMRSYENPWASFTSRGMDRVDFQVSPEEPVFVAFLPVGIHRLAFEAPGLWGELPPRRVEKDGSLVELTLELRSRGSVLLRLVDGKGGRVERAGVKAFPLKFISSVDPAGNTSYNVEGGSECSTDDRGEADLTELLPAPSTDVLPGTEIGIILHGEGIYRGGTGIPNLVITLDELARRVREAGAEPVFLDVSTARTHPLPVQVSTPGGEPVEGVHVSAEPAGAFARADLVSDAAGRILFELLEDEPPLHLRTFDRRTGRPEPVPRRVLRAAAPWIGETGLVGERGAPIRLIVRNSRNLVFHLVDGEGNPLRNTEVRIAFRPARTDAEGMVPFEPHPRHTEILIQAPGHLPMTLDPKTLEGTVEVRLVRGREIEVVPRTPDGKPTHTVRVELLDPETGTPCGGGYVKFEKEKSAFVFIVPLRAVKLAVRTGEWRGAVVAGVEVEEIELPLTPK